MKTILKLWSVMDIETNLEGYEEEYTPGYYFEDKEEAIQFALERGKSFYKERQIDNCIEFCLDLYDPDYDSKLDSIAEQVNEKVPCWVIFHHTHKGEYVYANLIFVKEHLDDSDELILIDEYIQVAQKEIEINSVDKLI